jgi:hypothetical protein
MIKHYLLPMFLRARIVAQCLLWLKIKGISNMIELAGTEIDAVCGGNWVYLGKGADGNVSYRWDGNDYWESQELVAYSDGAGGWTYATCT